MPSTTSILGKFATFYAIVATIILIYSNQVRAQDDDGPDPVDPPDGGDPVIWQFVFLFSPLLACLSENLS